MHPLHTLKKYSALYLEFVKNCFAEALTYRLHFVLVVVMDIVFYLTIMGSVEFLFQHLDKIGPWNKADFMFFMAFMIAVEHLHMTFVSENFWEFAFDIRTGKLDFILLKPANTLFVIFFRSMRPATLINGLFPWAYLLYFGQQLGLGWWQWLLLPPLILLGLGLLVSIEILLCMSMFWTVESMGVNFLRMQLQKVARWPDFIYGFYAQKFFGFAIPVLLVGSAPVHFLKDPAHWQGLAWTFVLLAVLWGLILFFWRLGLRSYESASS